MELTVYNKYLTLNLLCYANRIHKYDSKFGADCPKLGRLTDLRIGFVFTDSIILRIPAKLSLEK